MEAEAVTNFREYLKIPSVHPNVDYSECVTFIKGLATKIGLKCIVIGSNDKPIIIITWEGMDKNAGSILLNSHMDVVPVCKEEWIYDPFGAVKDDKGNIYGRGTQDNKSTGIQHLEAVRRLKDKGILLKRTIHISFVPDEEIGGENGMGVLVKSEEFKRLNVAFALDEGSAVPGDTFFLYNDERCSAKLKIHCYGPTGHGSLLHLNTAGEKLHKILDAFMDFREIQVLKWKNGSKQKDDLVQLAEVTTINLTEIEGGIQNNVVPPEMVLGFDIRLSVTEDHEKFYNWVEEVCKSAGDGVFCEFLQKEPKSPKTVTDSSNPFWVAYKEAMDSMKFSVKVTNCYGATDARYLRRVGIPTIGLTPIRKTPTLLHANNEMINESTFLEGIDIYVNLIEAVANV